MKSAHAIYENFFETAYPALPLPKIWQVIYHEGIRGNHILFETQDMLQMQEFMMSPNVRLGSEETERLTEFAVNLFSCVDLDKMRQMLRHLSVSQKMIIFILYRRALSVWGEHLKKSLH